MPSVNRLAADLKLRGLELVQVDFRENPAWGRGREGRYTHGGLSLEESVVPVAVLV